MLVLWDLGSNCSTLEANIALRMPSEDTWAISLEMFMQMPGMVTFLCLTLCCVYHLLLAWQAPLVDNVVLFLLCPCFLKQSWRLGAFQGFHVDGFRGTTCVWAGRWARSTRFV